MAGMYVPSWSFRPGTACRPGGDGISFVGSGSFTSMLMAPSLKASRESLVGNFPKIARRRSHLEDLRSNPRPAAMVFALF